MWRAAIRLSALILLLATWVSGFAGQGSHSQARRQSLLWMAAGETVVVGVSGGAAESVVYRLGERGLKVVALMDKPPVSPLLQASVQSSKVKLVLTEKVESPEQLSSLLGSATVVVVGEEGDDDLRGKVKEGIKVLGGGETYWDTLKAKETEAAIKMFDRTLAALPTTIKELVCVVSVDSTSGKKSDRDVPNPLSGLLKATGVVRDGLTKYSQFCASNKIPFSAFRFGTLTGGVEGAEPLPFLGLPALEPELHPSYIHQGVVLTSPTSNQYASTELCTRNALAEAIVRKITTQQGGGVVDALVVSIVGNPPTDKDWSTLFQRMQTGSNVELLRVEFSEIKKPAALVNWLVDSWFPQALIDADAATILTGARPVRARKISDALVKIAWEELRADLSVRPVGGLEIRVEAAAGNMAPALSVVRYSEGMGAGDVGLSGEMQIVDKLLEGINKVVYKKGFAIAA